MTVRVPEGRWRTSRGEEKRISIYIPMLAEIKRLCWVFESFSQITPTLNKRVAKYPDQ